MVTVKHDELCAEPSSWRAIQRMPEGPTKEAWIAAAHKEIDALRSRGVFKPVRLADLPEDAQVIKMIWVFKLKPPPPGGTEPICKARACLLGNRMVNATPIPGTGDVSTSTINPLARMSTARLLKFYRRQHSIGGQCTVQTRMHPMLLLKQGLRG